MFQKILIGYDEPQHGGEAIALAEALRDPDTRALEQTEEMPEAEGADLLVVGFSRRSALGRRLPGSTAERLLHEAPCPVAVAPPGYSGGDIRRIGVAYDGSPEAGAALRAAEAFARERCTALTVYCTVESPLPTADIRPEWLLIQRVPAAEIASRAYGAVDLLFVGSRGGGPLRRALLGDVSGALVRAAGCPVVVTPRFTVAPRRAEPVVANAHAFAR